MGTPSLKFRVDFKEVQQAIGDLRRKVEDRRAVMQEIGDIIAEDIRNMIAIRKTDPQDKPWSPWADSTRKARERKGNAALGLLVDSGALLRSITAQVIGSHHTVQIGTNVKYAEYLNNGTEKMPARPFLGVSKRAQQGINEAIRLYLGENLK